MKDAVIAGASSRVFALTILVCLLACPAALAENVSRDEILSVTISSARPAQGDPVIVEVRTAARQGNAMLLWKGKAIPMKEAGPGRRIALIGIDVAEPPGVTAFSVVESGTGAMMLSGLGLTVEEKTFPVQELTLPKGMAEFEAEALDRIRGEAERLERLFAAVSPPAWEAPFLPPVEEYRPANFGSRRVINGEPRSLHAAVDVHVPVGAPVRAIASGAVAFAGEQFFGGRSVVLDHGGGVFSLYYHLREYDVAEGQRVEKGEKIGAVGSTGRATGPHLHFGVRAPGGRIDPSKLFDQAFD
ncbi:MAG: M23 family metallopeptidase [Deltaproteobacteria bacterium]|nr:M23 family metallopeptidase [Deltaproteobacteria bacterium]